MMTTLDEGELRKVFGVARRLWRGTSSLDPAETCLSLIEGRGPDALQRSVAAFTGDERDYVIASLYTLFLPEGRRKELGAYFTPPHLVRHLLARLKQHGLELARHAVHDPAAGGAAFVVPLVRLLARELLAAGVTRPEILAMLRARLSGMELDPGLARVANALVRRSLAEELGTAIPLSFTLVVCGDSLIGDDRKVDVVLGNPPYAKIGAVRQREWAPFFPDILGGQLNLYAMFLRRSMDMVRPGGLVSFVVPTSFLQGPEFRTLRVALMKHADLVCLDLIDKRQGLFLDVIQDACFVVFRRCDGATSTAHPRTSCALLHPDGTCESRGSFVPSRVGEPWNLPSLEPFPIGGHVLADYGYRCAVGHIVMNRHENLLSNVPGRVRVPLVRAACVRPDGTFELDRANGQHVAVLPTARYVVRESCVMVQRTANRKQARRINAAHLPRPLIEKHGGVVGENHVIFLLPDAKPKVTPAVLARLLNSEPVNERWAGMCSTASLSVKLLAALDLPPPQEVNHLQRLSRNIINEAVVQAYLTRSCVNTLENNAQTNKNSYSEQVAQTALWSDLDCISSMSATEAVSSGLAKR